MPDLMTHTFLGLILNKIFNKNRKNSPDELYNKSKLKTNNLLFFLIGNIMPDLVSRIPMIVYPKYIPFFDTYHTLLGGLLISYIFSLFFEIFSRKRIFNYLFLGSSFHQVIDMFQKNIFGNGNKIFFPLDIKINIGFLWPEDSVYLFPFLLAITLYLYEKTIKNYLKN